MSEAKKYTYRNTSTNDLTIIGVGFCKAGDTIKVNEPIDNPNFELIGSQPKTGKPKDNKE